MSKGSPPERGRPHRSSGSASVIVEDEVIDYPGTAEPLLPVVEATSVQTRPGPAPSNLTIYSSERASLLGLQHHTASVGIVVLQPGHCGFMWWDGSEDCKINGEPARRTAIYAQGAQDGFHACGGARRTMGMIVRRNDLLETVAALRGVDPDDKLLDQTVLELAPEAAARFRNGIKEFVTKTTRLHPEHRPGPKAADQAEAIFSLLVDAHLHALPEKSRADRACQPERIVRLAEERFFEAQGAPVSLADLCASTGVSQATLYRAFHTVCGMPPLAYFHKRRLTEAQRALLRSPAYRGAVKRVALGVGLTEFGRFSVEYRQLFGEFPTTTLNRKIVQTGS